LKAVGGDSGEESETVPATSGGEGENARKRQEQELDIKPPQGD
jgi:hypothetical protein